MRSKMRSGRALVGVVLAGALVSACATPSRLAEPRVENASLVFGYIEREDAPT